MSILLGTSINQCPRLQEYGHKSLCYRSTRKRPVKSTLETGLIVCGFYTNNVDAKENLDELDFVITSGDILEDNLST